MERRAQAAVYAAALLAACSGAIEGGRAATPGAPGPTPSVGSPGEGGSAGGPSNPPKGDEPATTPLPPPAKGGARLRLLTRAQLENSLRDLLGDVPIGTTESDDVEGGFASVGASYATISPHGVEQYDAAVLGALAPLFADPARRAALLGCTPQGPDDAACARRFVSGFGRRAWRRPLTTAELDRYTQLALAAGAMLKDASAGLMHATSALLTSPNFLYRVELGQPDGAGRARYTGWEMASRLSYFFWSTTPDAALLDAAEAGALTTAEGVRAQVLRLLASPRARAGLGESFARELVGLDDLEGTPKNDPRFTASLKQAMRAEVLHLFTSRFDDGADALDILDSGTAFVNAELGAVYGITGLAGTTLAPAPLPAGIPRAGLLGTAAVLSLQSKQDATSPTARGKFVREAVLCEEVADPPDNLDTTFKDPPAGTRPTLREHLEMHRANPVCASCHAVIDPLGYAFESFDWIGAYRDKDNGKPVDTTGDLDGTPFKNAREFVAALRKLPETEDCLLRNVFRYASGHRETAADAATLASWRKAFEANGRHLVPFLTEIAAADDFRTVSPAP